MVMTDKDYAMLLGMVLANLQGLELHLRAFLYVEADPPHTPLPNGKNLNDLAVGDEVAVNALTSWDSLGDLIKRYNKLVDKNRRVDPSVVELRDALAHGRVSALEPSGHFRLMKFTQPNNGMVKVVFSQVLTEEWLVKQVKRTLSEVKKVAGNKDIQP